MAWIEGTADDHIDLMDKLRDHVVANGGEEVEHISGTHTILKLLGSGSDEIFIGAKIYSNSPENNFAWILNGFTGYTDGNAWENQLGGIVLNPGALALWDTTIPYWLSVSSRRVLLIAKIGTTYHMAYLGLCLPNGAPSQWSYPMVASGSTYRSDQDGNNLQKPYKYSLTDARVSNFWHPLYENASQGTLWVRTQSGWRRLRCVIESTETWRASGTFPYYQRNWVNIRRAPGGTYPHRTIEIIDGQQPGGFLGYFEGMRAVPGEDLAAETVVSDDSGDYMAFPNVFRTAENQWCLVEMV